VGKIGELRKVKFMTYSKMLAEMVQCRL
jgi:hypothetical protein